MLSEFNQLDSILGVEWVDILEDIPKLVEGVLSLLSVYEKDMSSLFGLPILKCMTCNRNLQIENQLTHKGWAGTREEDAHMCPEGVLNWKKTPIFFVDAKRSEIAQEFQKHKS